MTQLKRLFNLKYYLRPFKTLNAASSQKSKSSGKRLGFYVASIFVVILSATFSYSADIGLEWDPNSEPELAGYRLYYGIESGNYASSVDVGNKTNVTLSNLEYDTIYYFAVTAYTASGVESGYSAELAHMEPAPDPGDGGGSEIIDSDNDGISDTDETDRFGTDPYNPDTDGDGFADGQEINAGSDPVDPNSMPDNVKIWIEAEDGDTYAPMEIADDPEASGGGYVWVPDGAGSGGHAEYSFEVPVSGDYVIWGRVISNDGSSDSFLVAVDGGTDTTWHTKQGGVETWTWDVVAIRDYTAVRDTSNPLTYNLEAGSHTLSIKQREDGTKIDKILVTNDMNFVPEGLGEPIESVSQNIWIEAEEANVYAPMEIASDANASDGGYIWVPDGAGTGGYAEYTFDVSEAGDYVIWSRVISNDGSSDSFLVSVDGGNDITWHTKQGGEEIWTWDVVSIRSYADVRDASNPNIYHLAAGTHTLTIKQREDGTKIDKILITNNMGYVPDGSGEQSPSFSGIWMEAEDGSLYTPMEIASDPNATAGSYVWVPKGAGDGGYAEYTFEITDPGDYVIWSRIIANDGSSDSFLVSVDGETDITWHTKQGGEETWTWDVVSIRSYADVRDASNPNIYNLSAGTHTLTVKQRETGTKLDRILITDDLEYVPE